MMTLEDLIQTDEYWKEIIENAIWRVKREESDIHTETDYILRKVRKLIQTLKKQS